MIFSFVSFWNIKFPYVSYFTCSSGVFISIDTVLSCLPGVFTTVVLIIGFYFDNGTETGSGSVIVLVNSILVITGTGDDVRTSTFLYPAPYYLFSLSSCKFFPLPPSAILPSHLYPTLIVNLVLNFLLLLLYRVYQVLFYLFNGSYLLLNPMLWSHLFLQIIIHPIYMWL